MRLNSKISKGNTTLFIAFLTLFITACTSLVHEAKQPVYAPKSGYVVFSRVITNKVKKGTLVSGNIRTKSTSGKRISIPGHIHITLTGQDGKILETIKARTHRKYGNSAIWHFDGLIKTLPLKGSLITVKYHGRQLE